MARRQDFGEYAVVYCRSCALGRLAPLPTPEVLAALYGSAAYFEGADSVGYASYADDAPQFSLTFRRKLQHLLRFGAVTDLLEVGCGPGYFLAEAKREGIAGLVGVDFNPWAIEQARRHGIEAHVGSLDALPAGRAFDAAVMLDVLEHVTDPFAFLEHVHRLLRPGGRLLIMTPNIRSLLAYVSGRRWVSFKIPEHVYYYSPRSIRLLLARCGFEALSVRGTGQYVTLPFLLSRLQRIVPGVGALRALAERSPRLRDRVLFVTNGSIDVVARRRER